MNANDHEGIRPADVATDLKITVLLMLSAIGGIAFVAGFVVGAILL